METAAFCTIASFLTITPNRSQVFQYESLRLTCEVQGNFTAKRNVSFNGNISECSTDWGQIITSQCVIPDLYPEDTGAYWCESAQGTCTHAVNITVTDGDVILESPVLPVKEGSGVTLRCLYKDNTTVEPSSDLPAGFYKDGSLIRTESTGQMTIHNVSKSDEGFYKCHISDLGESPESWMDVTGQNVVRGGASSAYEESSRFLYILLPVLACVGLSLASLVMWSQIRRRRRGRGELDLIPRTYTDITFTEPVRTNTPMGGWAVVSPLYYLFIEMNIKESWGATVQEGHRRSVSPVGVEPRPPETHVTQTVSQTLNQHSLV